LQGKGHSLQKASLPPKSASVAMQRERHFRRCSPIRQGRSRATVNYGTVTDYVPADAQNASLRLKARRNPRALPRNAIDHVTMTQTVRTATR